MKYSKQREEILNIVKMSDCHPTADAIYTEARKKIPNISLGTVYRNLKFLVETNAIKQIKGLDEKDRFDKTIYDHGHLLCIKCGKVFDVDRDSIKELKENIGKDTGFQTENYMISITGICHNCQKTKERGK